MSDAPRSKFDSLDQPLLVVRHRESQVALPGLVFSFEIALHLGQRIDYLSE